MLTQTDDNSSSIRSKTLEVGDWLLHYEATPPDATASGVRAVVLSGVLVVQGTDQDDTIDVVLSATQDHYEVYDNQHLVEAFAKDFVHGIQVVALDGNDDVSLAAVETPGWVYGG